MPSWLPASYSFATLKSKASADITHNVTWCWRNIPAGDLLNKHVSPVYQIARAVTISLNSTYLYLLILTPTNLYRSTIDNSSQTQQRWRSFNCDTQTDLLVSESSANRGSTSRGCSPPAASSDWLLHQRWGTKKSSQLRFVYTLLEMHQDKWTQSCLCMSKNVTMLLLSSIYDFKFLAMQTPLVHFATSSLPINKKNELSPCYSASVLSAKLRPCLYLHLYCSFTVLLWWGPIEI